MQDVATRVADMPGHSEPGSPRTTSGSEAPERRIQAHASDDHAGSQPLSHTPGALADLAATALSSMMTTEKQQGDAAPKGSVATPSLLLPHAHDLAREASSARDSPAQSERQQEEGAAQEHNVHRGSEDNGSPSHDLTLAPPCIEEASEQPRISQDVTEQLCSAREALTWTGAASPASSSADAVGSEYDLSEDRQMFEDDPSNPKSSTQNNVPSLMTEDLHHGSPLLDGADHIPSLEPQGEVTQEPTAAISPEAQHGALQPNQSTSLHPPGHYPSLVLPMGEGTSTTASAEVSLAEMSTPDSILAAVPAHPKAKLSGKRARAGSDASTTSKAPAKKAQGSKPKAPPRSRKTAKPKAKDAQEQASQSSVPGGELLAPLPSFATSPSVSLLAAAVPPATLGDEPDVAAQPPSEHAFVTKDGLSMEPGSMKNEPVKPGDPSGAQEMPAPELIPAAAGKGKPKAPRRSRAKPKAQAESPGGSVPKPLEEGGASSEALQSPAPATAPKRKGPLAKLRPADMEGSVSELELEPGSPKKGARAKATPRKRAPKRSPGQAEILPAGGAAGHPQPPLADDASTSGCQPSEAAPPRPFEGGVGTWSQASSNVFARAQPVLYPAQAYYPPRHQASELRPSDSKSPTTAAESGGTEVHWSEASTANRPSSPSAYDKAYKTTSPTTAANTIGSVGSDGASDATSLSPDQSLSFLDLDPRLYPAGWKPPCFDLMDPDLLMTTMRERTVWTFWDCFLPLGCRDQDMVLLSNDGVAFPCAAWNPCLFSTLLERVIKNPSRAVRIILQRGAEENRKQLGYTPLPCIMLDENWHSSNLLLSFLHPIPTMFLPDRTTCRLVLDLGMRYGIDRAVTAATQRLSQLDQEDAAANGQMPAQTKGKGKGKARSTEEEIAVALAEGTAEATS